MVVCEQGEHLPQGLDYFAHSSSHSSLMLPASFKVQPAVASLAESSVPAAVLLFLFLLCGYCAHTDWSPSHGCCGELGTPHRCLWRSCSADRLWSQQALHELADRWGGV